MGIQIRGQEMLRTGYAEKREKAPKLALLDNFENCATSMAHGEMTESVLNLPDEVVQRYHCGNSNAFEVGQLLQAPPDKLGGMLRAYVALSGAFFYHATAENLQQVLTEQPGIKVVSQSQSQSPVRVAEPFYTAAIQDQGFRQRLGQALGVGADADVLAVGDALFAASEKFLRQEEAVQQAQSRYLKVSREAHEQGLVHVVPAGNLGEMSAQLEAKGHQFSPSAFRSLLVNDFTTVVGALDEQGQLASLNSPRSGIEVLAPGVNVPIFDPDRPEEILQGSGTSLSVPLVAAQVVQLLQEHPEWGAFEVEAALTGKSVAVRARQGQEVPFAEGCLKGDGQVDEFVQQAIGTGFLTGLQDESVAQFLDSDKNFRLVLPGETPDVNQVVDCRGDGEGNRKFTLETYFGSSCHVVRGTYANGAWLPERTVEEFQQG